MYDLPGWEYEAATKWVGQHLPPDKIGALRYHNAERNDQNGSHTWCWQSPTAPHEMLVISVSPGNPVSSTVIHGKDDPAGC